MFSLKKLFSKKTTVSVTPELPVGFSKKFRILQQEILRLGKEQGRNRTETSISLNNKDAPYENGTKEWVIAENNELYLRYYDLDRGSCESLYKMSYDPDKENYVLQRKYEFDSAEEAITVFVNLMEEYADPSFMRPLKERLAEHGVVSFDDVGLVETAKVTSGGDSMGRRQQEPLIK